MDINQNDGKTSNQIIKETLQKVSSDFGFDQELVEGFEQLDGKLSLSKLSADELEIFFINFFRAVYSRLAKQFNIEVDWSPTVPIPKKLQQELAKIPDITQHYFSTIKSLQQDILLNT